VLAGRLDEARALAARVRAAIPNYSVADFFSAFRFTPDTQVLFRRAAQQIGFA
jgi:hypothetical protein